MSLMNSQWYEAVNENGDVAHRVQIRDGIMWTQSKGSGAGTYDWGPGKLFNGPTIFVNLIKAMMQAATEAGYKDLLEVMLREFAQPDDTRYTNTEPKQLAFVKGDVDEFFIGPIDLKLMDQYPVGSTISVDKAIEVAEGKWDEEIHIYQRVATVKAKPVDREVRYF